MQPYIKLEESREETPRLHLDVKVENTLENWYRCGQVMALAQWAATGGEANDPMGADNCQGIHRPSRGPGRRRRVSMVGGYA